MRLFSYVLRYDNGFAPNPYGRYCTLATCKPQIRRHAHRGDWVVGVGSKNNVGNGKVIYAMLVSEVLSIEEYNADSRFHYKKPDLEGKPIQRCGDNIYYKEKSGRWRQRPSLHGPGDMNHDLGGQNVLIARHFFYLGADAEPIPARYMALVCRGRGHRCKFPDELVEGFVAWLFATLPAGQHGDPSNALPSVPEVDSRKARCYGSKRRSMRRCH